MRMTRKRRKAKEQRREIDHNIKNVISKGSYLAVGAVLAVNVAHSGAAYAMPQGGQVAAGQAVIHQAGTTMTIAQQTAQAILNWRHFGILPGEHVNFIQPGADSIALNRVLGNDPSAIFGKLTANGRVILVNPNGVYFAPGAQVNVGSMMATSLSITDADFMNGRYRFQNNGGAGSVVNAGALTAGEGGLIALLAPEVKNEGVIVAKKGTVALAAGDCATLDYAGDGKIQLAVTQGAVKAAVNNRGLIEADGGVVLMTAKGSRDVVSSVVNQDGIVRARSLDGAQGAVIIDAQNGSANINGAVDVSGTDVHRGGTFDAFGKEITLGKDAAIDASGKDGGTVRVGGDWQGRGDAPHADKVTVAKGAAIHADARANGDGGTVAVWSDGTTKFNGVITATGGAQGGDGGKVETSGHTLQIGGDGKVDASAAQGVGGEWLLDPYDMTVVAGSGGDVTAGGENSTVGADTIAGILNGGTNVTIATGGSSPGTQAGNITVNADIKKTGGSDATLKLDAYGSIAVNANITSTAGKLNVDLDAVKSTTGGTITLASGKTIATNGGAVIAHSSAASANNFAVGSSSAATIKLDGTVNTGGGAIELYGKNSDAGSGVQIGGALTSGGGKITIHGDSSQGAGIKVTGTVDSGAGDVELASDHAIEIGGAVKGGGTATVKRLSDGKISIGTGATTGLALKSLAKLQDFAAIHIGDSVHTDTLSVDGAAAFTTDVTLESKGAVNVGGTLTAKDKTVTVTAGGASGGAGAIESAVLDLEGVAADYNFTGQNKVGALVGDAKSVQFTNAGDLEVGVAGDKGLTVRGASSLASKNGDVTLKNSFTAASKANLALTAGKGISLSSALASSGGDISLTAKGGTITLDGTARITAGAGDVTLKAKALALGDAAGGAVSGTGTLTIDNAAKGATIGIGDAAADELKISAADFGASGTFSSSFDEVVIGGKDTGNVNVADALTVGSDLTVNSGAAIALAAGGALKTSGNQDVTLNSKALQFASLGSSGLSAGSGTLTLNTNKITNWAQADFGGSSGGTLVITPQAANQALHIGGASESDQLAVTQTGLAKIAAGSFANVTIGKVGGSGAVTLGTIASPSAHLTINGGAGTLAGGAVISNAVGQDLTLNLKSLTQTAESGSKFDIKGGLKLAGSGDFSLLSNTNSIKNLAASGVKNLTVHGALLGVGADGIEALGNMDWLLGGFSSNASSGAVTAGGSFTLNSLTDGQNIVIGGAGSAGDLVLSKEDIAKITANGANGITIGSKEYTGKIEIGEVGADTKFNSLLNLLTKQEDGSQVNLHGNVYVGNADPYKNLTIYTWEMEWPGNLYVHDLTLNIGKGLTSSSAANVHGTGSLNVQMPTGMDIYISNTAPVSGYQIAYNILNNMTGFDKLTVAGDKNIYIDTGTFNQSVDISSGEGAEYGVTVSGMVTVADNEKAEALNITGNTITLEENAGIYAAGGANVTLTTDSLVDNAVKHGDITGNGGKLTVQQVATGTALTLDGTNAASGGLVIDQDQLSGDGSSYWLGKGFANMTLGRGDSAQDVTINGGVTINGSATVQTGSGAKINITGGDLMMGGGDSYALTLKGGTVANNANTINANSGTVQFYADRLDLTGAGVVKGSGALGIGSYGQAISLGNTSHGGLDLTDTFLTGGIFTGFDSYSIGGAGQKIFVDGSQLDKDLTLTAGDIDFKGNLTLRGGGTDKNLIINASGYAGQTDGSLDDTTDAPQATTSAITAGDVTLNSGSYNLNSTTNKLSGTLTANANRVNVASDKLTVGSINGGGGAIILSADAMTFNAGSSLQSTGGLLTLQQLSAGHGMQIGGNAPTDGSLYLASSLFGGSGAVKDGFAHGVYLGRLDLSGKVQVTGDLSFVDSTYIRSAGAGGSVDVGPGTITTNGNAITFQTDKLTTAGTSTNINSGVGDITLSANDMDLKDGTKITGKGKLTLETWSKEWDENIYIGGEGPGPGPGEGLWLKRHYFESGANNVFTDGFDEIILGNADAKGTLTQQGDVGFMDKVTVVQGSNQSDGGGFSAKDITITTNNNDYEVKSQNVAFDNVIVEAGTGSVKLEADHLSIVNGTQFKGNNLVIDTYTPGEQISIGGSGGLVIDALWFADATFAGITGDVQLGSKANTGGIHLTGTLETNNNLSLVTGGNVTSEQSAVVDVNGKKLNIEGNDISVTGTLTDVGELTAAADGGAVKLTNTNNTITSLGDIKGGGVTINEQDGVTITGTVESVGAGNDVAITVDEGALTIGSAGTVKSKHDIYITANDKDAGKFINQSGADAFDADGRWVTYTYDSMNDTYGGLTGDFRKYGTHSLGELTDKYSGSGSAHVMKPTAHITADKNYGDANAQFFDNGSFVLTILEDADGGANRQQADKDFLSGATDFLQNTIFESQKKQTSYTFGSYIQGDGYDGEKMNVNKNIGGSGRDGAAYGTAFAGTDKEITYLESSNLLNYDVNVEFWVKPKKVTVTADGATMEYNGGNNYSGGGGLGYKGFANGQTAANAGISGLDNLSTSITKNGGDYTGKLNVGDYGLTINGGLYADNYVFEYQAGNLTVTKKEVTVTAQDANKVYDGNGYAGGNGVRYEGFVSGENAGNVTITGGASYGGNSQGAVNAGNYVIDLGGNLSSENYTFKYADGALNVSKKEVTVQANDHTVDYGQLGEGGYHGGNGWGNFSGFVGGDTFDTAQGHAGSVSGYIGDSQGANAPGSGYQIGLVGDLSADNYVFTYLPGYLTITDVDNKYNPRPPQDAANAAGTASTVTQPQAPDTGVTPDLVGGKTQQPAPPLMSDIGPEVPALNVEGMVSVVDAAAAIDSPQGDIGVQAQGRESAYSAYADRAGFGLNLDGAAPEGYDPERSSTKGAIPLLYTDYSSVGTDHEQSVDGFYTITCTPERLSIEPEAQGTAVPRRDEIQPDLRQDYSVKYQESETGAFQVAVGNGIVTIHPLDDQAVETVNGTQKAPQRAVMTTGVLRALQDFGIAPDQLRAIYIFREKMVLGAVARKG